MHRRLILMALIALLALAGCQSDESEQGGTTAASESRAEAMFSHVPADTPYLFANLQSTPEPVLDTTFRALEETGRSMKVMFDAIAEEAEDPAEREKMQAVFAEIESLMSREGFRNAGLREDGLYVVYAQGLMPVMRWEVADPAAVAETVGRFEAALDMEFPRRSHDGADYWWIEFGPQAGLVAAVVDDELVVGMTTGAEPEIDALLGGSTPDNAYAIDDLESFNSELGYTGYGSGFIQFPALLERIMDAEDPQLGWLHEDPQFAALAGNEACRAELGALFEVFPRVVSGSTGVNAEAIHSHARLDIREDYAQRLAGIVDAPLELSDDPGSLMNFGMAINIVNLRDFLRAEADHLASNVPECPIFSGLQENITELQANLNRPIPPVVTNLHGFKLRLASADITDGKIENVSASFALAMRNPQLLLGMAQMFSPALAELNLTPGGEPQPLPEGTVPAMEGMPSDQLFIAMSDNALGIALGAGQKDQLGSYLDIAGDNGGTFMSFAMDTEAYAEMVKAMTKTFGESMMDDMEEDTTAEGENGDAEDGNGTTDEEKMEEMLENQPSLDFMSSLYERYFTKVRFTDKGLEMVQDARLKQND